MFGGTILAGGAIAIGNVLLPALVKRDFPQRAGAITGRLHDGAPDLGGVAAGLSVPIATAAGGWRGGLVVWAVPALLTFLVWSPQLRHRTLPIAVAAAGSIGDLLRTPLAWQVTLFFGLQSLEFYAVVSWLPTIYRMPASPGRRGPRAVRLDPGRRAGCAHHAVDRDPGPRPAPARVLRLRAARGRTGGVVVAPLSAPGLWAILIGIGNGASFPLALTLLVLRTRSSRDTARLSAMAQSVGYLIAATGPVIVGAVHDLTGRPGARPSRSSWSLLVPQTLAGVAAGRRLLIGRAPAA